ncbi:choline transporter BetT [Pontibacillus halophilus JSM 076056 = DSM 19796]|uniref:Choline transporter BetT n=1 Tax=Pontibacillus halophilus JSM 076056 = DSM 19796 TaxID=1385510 RepID=A0A0A5GEJ6_9BACI|nr:BCCT family transporter [Pontibacillus halophilus]KGX91641.1 choline transporter BetT [Pontibacillus halophilus JSM 076056 = DSM 19796]
MKRNIIDWPTFIGAFILLISVTIPLVLFPEAGAAVVNDANEFMTSTFGVVFLIMGLASFFFVLYVSYSKNGQIKLGDEDEEPEFGKFSWAAMLFCGGIGSSILYWGTIEWAYYYQSPPFGIEAGTEEAIAWSSAYGIFHWGPVAWAIYTLPALAIAYFYYVRKRPVLKVSEACRPVIGKYADGWLGKVIDILFIFGILGGAGTTLALGTPMIAQGVSELTGLQPTLGLKTFILLLCTAIFGVSAYTGLKKGIKVLSDINLWLAIFLLVFVFIFGPTLFISESTINSLGVVVDNFFRMGTWTEPFGDFGPFAETKFPEGWTVFYWAWWLVYAPYIGLFVAKISRGRTIKQMAMGTMVYGTLGCVLFFGVIGNYGLYMQLSGEYDVLAVLAQQGAPAAIIEVFGQLPLGTFIVGIFTVLAVIFLATSFDSSSYILASVAQRNVEDEPLRWNRLFWAFSLAILPLTLMYIGGLSTLQTASIIGGTPQLFIMALLAWSFMKASNEDLRASENYKPKTIYLNAKEIKKRRKKRRQVLQESQTETKAK